MSNKVTMEVKANLDSDGVELATRGSFHVYYSKRSEINSMLNTKDGQRFKVTIERIPCKGK